MCHLSKIFTAKFVQNSFDILWIAMDLTVSCPIMILVLAQALTMLIVKQNLITYIIVFGKSQNVWILAVLQCSGGNPGQVNSEQGPSFQS